MPSVNVFPVPYGPIIRIGGRWTAGGEVIASTASFCLALRRGSRVSFQLCEGDQGIDKEMLMSGYTTLRSVNLEICMWIYVKNTLLLVVYVIKKYLWTVFIYSMFFHLFPFLFSFTNFSMYMYYTCTCIISGFILKPLNNSVKLRFINLDRNIFLNKYVTRTPMLSNL